MIGAIAAVSSNQVIGSHGSLPWYYPADLQRFKRITLGKTLIMGRKTWESLGKKTLPGRRNIVVTGSAQLAVETVASIQEGLRIANDDIWFIGGGMLYAEALAYCETLDITHIPLQIDDPDAVRFPIIDPRIWSIEQEGTHPDDSRLSLSIYKRHRDYPPAAITN